MTNNALFLFYSFFEAVEHHLRHDNIIEDHSTIRLKGVAETWSTYATNEDAGIVSNIDLALFGDEMDKIPRKEKFPSVIQHCHKMRRDGIFAEAEFIRGTI